MVPAKPHSTAISRSGQSFRSKAEYEWWEAVWKTRPVTIERSVDIESFNADEFPQFANINSRPGWKAYLKQQGNICNLTVCTEFLAGLLPSNAPFHYNAFLRNKAVSLNPESLSRVMGIEPLEGPYDIPYDELPVEPSPDQLASFLAGKTAIWPKNRDGGLSTFQRKQNLHTRYDILWLCVCNALMPTSQKNRLNLEHARIMEAIANNRPFCLVRFFIQEITLPSESDNMKDAIKMGILITKLCQAAGVEFRADDRQSEQLSPLDKRSHNRSLGQTKKARQDVPNIGVAAVVIGPDGLPVEEEGDEEGAAEGTAEHQASASQPRRQKRKGAAGAVPSVDMDALFSKMQELQVSSQSHYTSITENQQRFSDHYDQGYGQMQTKVGEMQGMMGQIQSGFGVMNERYGAMNTRQGILEEQMGQMRQDFGTLQQDMSQGFTSLEEKMQELLNRFPPPH